MVPQIDYKYKSKSFLYQSIFISANILNIYNTNIFKVRIPVTTQNLTQLHFSKIHKNYQKSTIIYL